jgi:RNA polymerase sigma-70 factor, ECF subfamily
MPPATSSMDPRKLSLQELLSYCLETQDPDAWTELVRRIQPLIAGVVYRCVFRRIGPKLHLVDDLVQATYLKLCANNFKALRDFDFQHDNAFFGFLKVVASHVVEDHFRGSKSQKRGSGCEDEDIDDVRPAEPFRPNSLQPAEMAMLMDQIDRCLAKLASEPNFTRDYTIFWLYYRQGLTAKAISQLPGIKLGTKGVESTLLRLIRYIKACLKSPPPPPRKKASGG